MANEATIRSSLQILKGNLNYQSRPTVFQGDIVVANGPAPGAVCVEVTGTDISFNNSACGPDLTTPAYCRIQNLDTTNFVEYGIWDGATFYPLGEVLPGESYVIRLSRNLTEEFGTGTSTTGDDINTLRFRADTAKCNVLVEAFDA